MRVLEVGQLWEDRGLYQKLNFGGDMSDLVAKNLEIIWGQGVSKRNKGRRIYRF